MQGVSGGRASPWRSGEWWSVCVSRKGLEGAFPVGVPLRSCPPVCDSNLRGKGVKLLFMIYLTTIRDTWNVLNYTYREYIAIAIYLFLTRVSTFRDGIPLRQVMLVLMGRKEVVLSREGPYEPPRVSTRGEKFRSFVRRRRL